MPMTPYLQSMTRTPLESWGEPEAIGSETLEGPIELAGSFDIGAPDKPVFGGQFSATKGKYRAVYGFHEHATLLDGEVALTDEASGETVVYKAGDSWIISKGSSIIWDIRSDQARKSYIAIVSKN
jgi:uncharacterized cupin superfamily protein